MSELILHHYELSPFSEKVRRVLAYKKLPWRAVEQPVMAPKPELTPLTGGYRRIPVLQVGADVYCDTALILRRLEALHPEPPLVPRGLAGAAAALEDWADHRLFMFAVPPTVVDLLDALPPGFIEDRQKMSPGFSKEALVAGAPHALDQMRHALDMLAAQLDATPFLLGDAFTLADAACFHPVRFFANSPRLAAEIEQRPAVAAWVGRIEAFGPGDVTPLGGADALAVARDAEPADVDGDSVAVDGWGPGDSVTIVADDYGQETTAGRVARVRDDDVTVLREDDAVGTVAVHYPRAGYRITRA